MMHIDEERKAMMQDLKCYIENIIEESSERRLHDDPYKRAAMHGYIDAMTEILEYIEDVE